MASAIFALDVIEGRFPPGFVSGSLSSPEFVLGSPSSPVSGGLGGLGFVGVLPPVLIPFLIFKSNRSLPLTP